MGRIKHNVLRTRCSLIFLIAPIPSWLSTSNRIVGGVEALSPIPWQVFLTIPMPIGTGTCGGTILNKDTILSARHCVEYNGTTMTNGLKITAGLWKRSSTSEAQVNLETLNLMLSALSKSVG